MQKYLTDLIQLVIKQLLLSADKTDEAITKCLYYVWERALRNIQIGKSSSYKC